MTYDTLMTRYGLPVDVANLLNMAGVSAEDVAELVIGRSAAATMVLVDRMSGVVRKLIDWKQGVTA